MSDFDRNVAARPLRRRTGSRDRCGLRAYMLRVYNYMATGVALTGVVAWFTFNAATVSDGAGQLVLTPFGQMIFGGPLTIVLFLVTLGLVFFLSFRISHLQPSTALALFMLYAGLLGLMLSSVLMILYRALAHPHFLHLGGLVRRAQPLRLHHEAGSFPHRLVPDHGIVRVDPGDGRQLFPQKLGA